MAAKERVLLVVVSILLVYSAGSWAVLFFMIYQGGRVLVEWNTPVLLAEVGLSCCFTLVGLGSMCVMLSKLLSQSKEAKHDKGY